MIEFDELVAPPARRKKKKSTENCEMQQCIGPVCTYDATSTKSSTGFTWKELQEYRENNIRKRLALLGIEVTAESLLNRPVPSYEQYWLIVSKEVSR